MLADYRELLDTKLKDAASKLTPAEKDVCIQGAVRQYSLAKPRTRVHIITGDGVLVTHPLPADFEEGFSSITQIEYPVGHNPPEFLDGEQFGLYRSLVSERGPEDAVSAAAATLVLNAAASANDDAYNGMWVTIISNGTAAANGQTREILDYLGSTKTATVAPWTTVPTGTISYRISRWALALRLFDLTLASAVSAYLAYTARHAVNEGAAAQDTVPSPDRDPICHLAAALGFDSLAALYTQETDPSMQVDVSRGSERAGGYLELARHHRSQYKAILGLGKDAVVGAASAIGDLDQDLEGWGGPRFFHDNRGPR